MNQRPFKIVLFLALASAIAVLNARGQQFDEVYGQQEIDPTWYDPWANSSRVVVQSREAKVDEREPKRVNARPPQRRTSKSARAKTPYSGTSGEPHKTVASK